MELQASPLITEVPSLSNGGITENPFSITYHLNPKAVWADGTAITCADVTFTWAAMLYTSDRRFIYYDGFGSGVPLTKVECPESTTVILRLAKVFAPWPNLFGGADGFVLEKSAFATVPGFPDKPDLKDAFKDSIPFSGGPWVLHRWSKEQATLVRNPRYWDRKTYIDQVTFVPKKTSDQEAGLRDNDVNVVFQPSPTATQSSSFRADPSLDVAAGPDEWADALWFNLDDPVVGDVRIRRALAYAFERDAVARGVPGAERLRALGAGTRSVVSHARAVRR
jgi:peptide/nickel transport system substrate-binding protein